METELLPSHLYAIDATVLEKSLPVQSHDQHNRMYKGLIDLRSKTDLNKVEFRAFKWLARLVITWVFNKSR